ncbi:hypothetical protein [Methanolapillus millepedarum]|uniref:Uncharacterized protein n=1 Tax=Methanolapillus millepedarum TaxID=3028296 RepID=A0AA96VDA6_9EURY|nr:hypothetical protein MsAc7_17340 [Methanosarcinaceae archaeon Ac7]
MKVMLKTEWAEKSPLGNEILYFEESWEKLNLQEARSKVQGIFFRENAVKVKYRILGIRTRFADEEACEVDKTNCWIRANANYEDFKICNDPCMKTITDFREDKTYRRRYARVSEFIKIGLDTKQKIEELKRYGGIVWFSKENNTKKLLKVIEILDESEHGTVENAVFVVLVTDGQKLHSLNFVAGDEAWLHICKQEWGIWN